jgi:hypothetical protein
MALLRLILMKKSFQEAAQNFANSPAQMAHEIALTSLKVFADIAIGDAASDGFAAAGVPEN